MSSKKKKNFSLQNCNNKVHLSSFLTCQFFSQKKFVFCFHFSFSFPPPPRQGLGALRGKIDLDFVSSPAPMARHRALLLVPPITVGMTGEYACKVSTLQNEVSASARMVVYGEERAELLGEGRCPNLVPNQRRALSMKKLPTDFRLAEIFC